MLELFGARHEWDHSKEQEETQAMRGNGLEEQVQ